MPGNRYIDSKIQGSIAQAGLLRNKAADETRIATLEKGQGTVEIYLRKGKIAAMLVLDVENDKAYKAEFDLSGAGLLAEQAPDQFYCVRYPAVSPATQDAAPDIAETAPTPDLDTLKHLQSKSGVTNILYINYWGGSYTSPAWNDGNTINYTPFSQDADTASFSDKERHDMWLGWAEAAEDYAPFNINVTTDSALYAATPEDKCVFGLVIDFGTSQSPKSTRPLTTYWCPSRPGHQALRNNFASSLLLRTCLPMTGRRVWMPTLLPLWRYAHDG